MKSLSLNLNEIVRVKLSEQGLAQWRERAASRRAKFPRLEFEDAPTTDADGFWRTQLYEVMHLIGPICRPGDQPTEDGCVHIDLPDDPT